MQRLYLEIDASRNVPSEIFVKLLGVPARRCELRGNLRVLNSECTQVSIAAEGPEEDVLEYYNYLRLSDHIVGTVTKVEENEIDKYSESKAFHVVNYGEASDDEDESIGEASDDEDESIGEAREPVAMQGDNDTEEIRVVPETPEKEETTTSESEAENEPSPLKEDSQTMYMEPPKSPVFKSVLPQRVHKPAVNHATGDMFDSEEESQSILRVGRKRRCKE